ncbi:MAG: D-2-hydroxyacid dehydrogenase [Oscillospiraceae bacterium]|nr:D-2-hydroxyacid dehydrogenase [Ruminococcus sp.]MCD8344685.1 D-2-hydroxyacid dehydrogenase [Oscillospiraceae bacterium]
MARAVILDADTVTSGDVSLEPLTSLVDTKVFGFTSPDEIASNIGDAEIVLTNKCRITEEVFEKCPGLKFIGLFATGYNNIEIEAARRHSCVVANVPGYSSDAVAQHTFALILNHSSKIHEYNDYVQSGNWGKSKLFTHFEIPLNELSGKTIGIIGYGAIGKSVAKIAMAFNMKVLVYTRTGPSNTLEEVLKGSDIVTLHCPLNDGTKELINAETLSMMKPTAMLVNTSRGGVINERDLAEALKTGKIAFAAIDVLTTEPISPDCPLLGLPNCVITPHVAWAPIETRVRLIGLVRDNIRAYLNGSPINNVAG